jgi:hypothetical protein
MQEERENYTRYVNTYNMSKMCMRFLFLVSKTDSVNEREREISGHSITA